MYGPVLSAPSYPEELEGTITVHPPNARAVISAAKIMRPMASSFCKSGGDTDRIPYFIRCQAPVNALVRQFPVCRITIKKTARGGRLKRFRGSYGVCPDGNEKRQYVFDAHAYSVGVGQLDYGCPFFASAIDAHAVVSGDLCETLIPFGE